MFYLFDSLCADPSTKKLKGLNPELSYTERESLLKPQEAKEKAIEILMGKLQMLKSNCLVTLLSYASFKTLSKSGKKGSFVKNRLWGLAQVLSCFIAHTHSSFDVYVKRYFHATKFVVEY